MLSFDVSKGVEMYSVEVCCLDKKPSKPGCLVTILQSKTVFLECEFGNVATATKHYACRKFKKLDFTFLIDTTTYH